MTWCLYVVRCSDQTLYTGITNDIEKRVEKHNAGTGAKYTRPRRPVRLLVTWPYADRSAASKAEYRFKKNTRAQKLAFIKNPETWT